MDTFDLGGRKVYIAGESYAGKYVPYIANAMLDQNSTEYFDLKGIMIYDPSIASDTLLEDRKLNSETWFFKVLTNRSVPAVPFVDQWAGLFNLNKTFMDEIHKRADDCGYTEYLETYLTYPPPSKLPTPSKTNADEGCGLFNDIFNAVSLTNPCFDVYQVATTCPLLWDQLGFPGSFDYLPEGEQIYFNRTDVQKAINAPIQEWAECANGVLSHDTSPDSHWTVLPRVIDAVERTVVVHADLDFVLLYNGTLLAIQNMTFGGLQGFQTAPSADFYVPYHDEYSYETLSSSGVMGVTHTERKLTWVYQSLSGHMVPQYQPSSAYRQLEFLLGRVDSLSAREPFTTQKDVPQPQVNGTAATSKRSIRMPRRIF